MKKIAGMLLMACTIIVSCSKKTHPAVSDSPPKSPETATRPAIPSPMIVIDDVGRVITSRDKLPVTIAAKVDYGRISRSFTPAQRQNLIYRYKIVPPRVLYVPDQLASKSGKGTYVVYKKKFYYWKKEDGLFHLDETYYQ